VTHGYVVAATVAFAVVLADRSIDVGMTVLFAVVYVGHAVVIEVLAGTLDTVVKALALNLPELSWRRIPAALILSVG
jgi:hypothetical protein